LGADGDHRLSGGDGQFRPFDRFRATTLEASIRHASAAIEAAVILHHVSRHISDRPKPFAVAWNLLGGRLLPGQAGTTTFDVRPRAARHAALAWTMWWMGEANLQVRHPFNPHAGVFAHGTGR
jgi:hypothetical protein